VVVMVSHSHKFIFVHITKTGGTSATQVLKKYLYDAPMKQHETAVECRDRIGKDLFSEYFKFTFVRNPWDKMVSMYHYLRQSKNLYRNLGISFKDWVSDVEKLDQEERSTSSQLSWIEENGEILVDFIGKFESYEEDFEKVKNKLQLQCSKLNHINQSQHLEYRSYYDEATKDIVRSRFEEDIEFFKYKF